MPGNVRKPLDEYQSAQKRLRSPSITAEKTPMGPVVFGRSYEKSTRGRMSTVDPHSDADVEKRAKKLYPKNSGKYM